MTITITTTHIRLLLVLSLTSRVLTLILLSLSSSHLTLFDSSPEITIITQSKWLAFLRWDVFHFIHIAQNGYQYEHEWAFFPGTPILMHFTAKALSLVNRTSGTAVSMNDLLVGGTVVALACNTTRTFYHLSLHHLGSPSLALLASLLSLLPSSPATLRFAPCSEPFFTYLSYRGMLYCARSQWLAASVSFAIAGMFRSNGVLLSGFIVWGLVIQPLLDGKKPSVKNMIYSIGLTGIICAPFVQHHVAAYLKFCTTHPAPWCSNRPPSIYAHVQSTYWNVGFLRYWTLQQLPNFLISAPPLLSLFYFCGYHVGCGLAPRVRSIFCSKLPEKMSKEPSETNEKTAATPFLSSSLTPHAIHALFLCTTILFNSHTQIILRLSPSMPITYWSAAWLILERPFWGRLWVAWSVIWGAISSVLWGTFLPPA